MPAAFEQSDTETDTAKAPCRGHFKLDFDRLDQNYQDKICSPERVSCERSDTETNTAKAPCRGHFKTIFGPLDQKFREANCFEMVGGNGLEPLTLSV